MPPCQVLLHLWRLIVVDNTPIQSDSSHKPTIIYDSGPPACNYNNTAIEKFGGKKS
jgi:hypothetical protein